MRIPTRTHTALLSVVAWLLLLAHAPVLRAAGAVSAKSPDGATEISVEADPLRYSVRFHGRAVLVDSPLGLRFRGEAPFGPMRIVSASPLNGDRTWTPVWGKTSSIVDRYNGQELMLQEIGGAQRRLGLTIRAYPDGVAFRYSVQPRGADVTFVLEKELSGFHFSGDPVVWAATTDAYHNSWEHEYPKSKLSALHDGSHVVLPLLAEVDPQTYAAVLEADLDDWAGLLLTPAAGTLTADLSPRLDGQGLVAAKAPHQSPWRVVMMGNSAGALLESNLIENLNPPSEIEDTSWIKPGKMAWDNWWSGDVKMDNPTNERYISFASQMGFHTSLWTGSGTGRSTRRLPTLPGRHRSWIGPACCTLPPSTMCANGSGCTLAM